MRAFKRLDRIKSPKDVKKLDLDGLREVADDIRQAIAAACSCNGGHFAASLGVVELTLAIHYVFDAPRDRIVWDVGHQAYAHKLLTGRADRFDTVRILGGLSGFPKRSESPYDTFGVGHASTSISAALGMALARDYHKENYNVVAVCGDGAMTGGLCYEGLNNVGYARPGMLLVLNDNEMSIAPNIGAMSRYFNHLITNDVYKRSKAKAKDLIKRMPAVGEKVLHLGHRIEGSIKSLIMPEETIFEKMGIRYLGPVDGHDLEELIEILSHLRDLREPALLHVKTIKGKGYSYSESDPERWHSGADFEISTGEKVPPADGPEAKPTTKPTYTEVFSRTLVELAERDERIVAITAAMAAGTGLAAFAKRFKKRFHDVGIAEEHAVTCAAGMACEGLRPVVAIYSTFLQRAYDQVIHDVALQGLPVTFAIDRAGIVGEDGPTHHGVFDLSYLRTIPGLVLMAPRDERQLRCMMATAAAYEKGPIAYRYPRGKGTGVSIDGRPEPIEIGTGEVLRKPPPGTNASVAILSIGTMAATALDAADALEADGIATAVVDMRFVKPLDRVLLAHFARTSEHLVTIEENVVAGGFGSAVIEALADMGEARQVLTIGLPDVWIEHGPIPTLHRLYGLSPESIVGAIRNVVAHAHSIAT